MIRTIIGAEAFRAGMDLYFERHDGQAATIEDFLQVFEDVSGRDLSQFSLWYHQAGTPNVTVTSSHDAASGQFVLEIEQSVPPTPDGKPQAADAHPARLRPGRRRRQGHRLHRRRGRDGRGRRHPSAQASPCRALQRRAGASGRVAQPRLFRAADAVGRAEGAGPVFPRQARRRPVLALAGLQHAADRDADRRLPQDHRRPRRGLSCQSSSRCPARLPRTARWSTPIARWR